MSKVVGVGGRFSTSPQRLARVTIQNDFRRFSDSQISLFCASALSLFSSSSSLTLTDKKGLLQSLAAFIYYLLFTKAISKLENNERRRVMHLTERTNERTKLRSVAASKFLLLTGA